MNGSVPEWMVKRALLVAQDVAIGDKVASVAGAFKTQIFEDIQKKGRSDYLRVILALFDIWDVVTFPDWFDGALRMVAQAQAAQDSAKLATSGSALFHLDRRSDWESPSRVGRDTVKDKWLSIQAFLLSSLVKLKMEQLGLQSPNIKIPNEPTYPQAEKTHCRVVSFLLDWEIAPSTIENHCNKLRPILHDSVLDDAYLVFGLKPAEVEHAILDLKI